MATNNNQVMVEREPYEYKGKTYLRYFVRGQIRGKDVRVSVTPPDNGGFAVLDIVFGNENKVPLTCTPFEIKDEKTGRVVSGNTYSVVTTDEQGNNFECKIKPFRSSDKMLLNMLLQQK